MDKVKLGKAVKYIDSWLDLRYRRNDWLGFTVAISHKGRLLFNKSYGYANLEKKEKLTPEHIFRIASQSKTFTAVAIMQLFESGKLKLDDPIVKYLKWLNKHKDLRFKQITIKQLLSHGAGIIRDGLDSDYWQLKRPFPSKEELKKEILEANLVLNPNKQLKYSNYGFSLLGLIVEKVTSGSYDDYVINKIIKSLRLTNTGPDLLDKIKDKLAVGYSRPDSRHKRIPIENVKTNALSPVTGFYSTSEDLCNYYSALVLGSGKLLKDASKKEMQKANWKVKNSKEKDKYGLGLTVFSLKDKEFLGHGGSFPGYSTITFFDPQTQLIVSVFMNHINGDAGLVGRGAVSIIEYFQKNYITDKSLNLTQLEGRYMSLWSIVDIISMGNRAIAIEADSWKPFEEVEKLKYIDESTLRINDTHGFYSEGELIKFKTKNKRIISINYAGSSMLPEKQYLTSIKKQKQICLGY